MHTLRPWLALSIAGAVIGAGLWVVARPDVNPWRAGGTGLFASSHGAPFRYVRIFVEAPGRAEEVAVAPSLAEGADRAVLFPLRTQFVKLARAVAARERRRARPVERVRIEVWCVEFEGPSEAQTERRVRTFTYNVTTGRIEAP